MATSTADQQPVPDLVGFLFSRRETILNQWRVACEADPTLPHVAMLSREEFNNLIGLLLEVLEARLLHKTPPDDTQVTATSHGLHRWQKAHNLSALIRELNHLTATLVRELLLFQELYPQVEAHQLLQAELVVQELMSQTMQGSVSKFDELQRLEAAGRLSSLQQILEQTNQLSRQRGELLRTASHDLRSGFGIIQGAAQLINQQDVSPEDRLVFQQMLNRNLGSMSTMLTQLMDLARLEAGQDPLHEEEVDVAELLTDLVASAQALAAERGLLLRADGPAPLRVKTDRVKLYRIAQNLVVNALKYTPSGLVSVSWSSENDWRWVLSVQDSGPGLSTGLLGVLHEQLKPTVELTSVLSPEEGQPTPVHPNADHQIPPDPARSNEPGSVSSPGEGVGLLIVKRLCELIGASLEVESVPGRGTLFRIRQMMH